MVETNYVPAHGTTQQKTDGARYTLARGRSYDKQQPAFERTDLSADDIEEYTRALSPYALMSIREALNDSTRDESDAETPIAMSVPSWFARKDDDASDVLREQYDSTFTFYALLVRETEKAVCVRVHPAAQTVGDAGISTLRSTFAYYREAEMTDLWIPKSLTVRLTISP